MGSDGEILQFGLPQFLETDMKGRFILSVELPPLSKDHIIKTFKIMPRSCNAHAYINAGFCAKILRQDSIRIVGKPTIIFGGIRSSLVSCNHKLAVQSFLSLMNCMMQILQYIFKIHASETENLLSDKCLDDEKIFRGALNVLEQELCPEEHLLNPDSDYLKCVAQGLFYKVCFQSNSTF